MFHTRPRACSCCLYAGHHPCWSQIRNVSRLSHVDSVDGAQHIAPLLMVLPPEGGEELAGVAHLVLCPDDPATADIAVTVADDWQGRGVGTALRSALLARRPAAVRRLRTVVDAGNRASLALLAGQGAWRPARLPRASCTSGLNSPLPSAPAATACECGRGGDLIELDHSIWTGPLAWPAQAVPLQNWSYGA